MATRKEGLTYWRKDTNEQLPDLPEPQPIIPKHKWNVNLDRTIHISPLYGFTDSDWVSDTQHRRSISRILYMMTGSAVVYKIKFKRTIALSLMEAEFVAASEAGKCTLYLCFLLNNPREPQHNATVLYE